MSPMICPNCPPRDWSHIWSLTEYQSLAREGTVSLVGATSHLAHVDCHGFAAAGFPFRTRRA
jgi:hypothetical protein